MRVLVADDSVLLREGLLRLLDEAGHTVVAAVGDAPSLLTAVAEHRPDAALVDIRMPPTHTSEGLDSALQIRRELPDVGHRGPRDAGDQTTGHQIDTAQLCERVALHLRRLVPRLGLRELQSQALIDGGRVARR